MGMEPRVRVVRRAEVDAVTKDARRARMAEGAAKTAGHIAELRAADARAEPSAYWWKEAATDRAAHLQSLKTERKLMDARQIGILAGGVVWCGFLFKPVFQWFVTALSGNGILVNLVFGAGGIVGFLACALTGAWIAGMVADRDKRRR